MKNKYLTYVPYLKDGKEVITDYTITAANLVDVKNKAMERIASAGGTQRYIDEVILMDKAFFEREKSFCNREGKRL